MPLNNEQYVGKKLQMSLVNKWYKMVEVAISGLNGIFQA